MAGTARRDGRSVRAALVAARLAAPQPPKGLLAYGVSSLFPSTRMIHSPLFMSGTYTYPFR